MATTLEIIQGINQAAANAYDGAHDERFVSGDAKKIGLSREEGCPIIDSRVLDGFGVKIIGDMLQINYEANIKLSDVYASGFEEECDRRIHAIADFLKKEYKIITGKSLSLSPKEEIKCIVQNTSRIRTFVMCHKLFKIGGMKNVETLGEGISNSVDVKYQKFLKEGRFSNHYWTLTLTSDINGGIENTYDGRAEGDILKTHLEPRDGKFVWLTGNHNETSSVPIGDHILKKHVKS